VSSLNQPGLALLAATLFATAGVTPLHAQAQSPEDFYNEQTRDFLKALNNPRVNSRVRRIWLQLADQTQRMYPVLPAQQYNAGQALPNGVIVLDVSIAGNDHQEVTAFWLAHEWAHQYYGHPQMQLTAIGQLLIARAGTAQEDAADRFAGRFLKSQEYDIEPVLSFLCRIPGGGANDAHSAGAKRAKNTAAAYGLDDYEGCGGDD